MKCSAFEVLETTQILHLLFSFMPIFKDFDETNNFLSFMNWLFNYENQSQNQNKLEIIQELCKILVKFFANNFEDVDLNPEIFGTSVKILIAFLSSLQDSNEFLKTVLNNDEERFASFQHNHHISP